MRINNYLVEEISRLKDLISMFPPEFKKPKRHLSIMSTVIPTKKQSTAMEHHEHIKKANRGKYQILLSYEVSDKVKPIRMKLTDKHKDILREMSYNQSSIPTSNFHTAV